MPCFNLSMIDTRTNNYNSLSAYLTQSRDYLKCKCNYPTVLFHSKYKYIYIYIYIKFLKGNVYFCKVFSDLVQQNQTISITLFLSIKRHYIKLSTNYF